MAIKINKIVIFSLDNLYTRIVFNKLAPTLKDKIDCVYLSDLYRKNKGSFLKQAVENFRRSGLSFSCYLSFVFIYYKFFLFFINPFLGDKKLKSLKDVFCENGINFLKIGNIKEKPLEKEINDRKPDLILSIYFDQLIPENVFSLSSLKAINVHPGILPDYRGPFPSFWAMLKGEKRFGISAHYLDNNFDTGELIFREIFTVDDFSSLLNVELSIFEKIPLAVNNLLELIAEERLAPHRQDQSGSYFSYPKSKDIKSFNLLGFKFLSFNFLIYLIRFLRRY